MAVTPVAISAPASTLMRLHRFPGFTAVEFETRTRTVALLKRPSAASIAYQDSHFVLINARLILAPTPGRGMNYSSRATATGRQ